MKIMTFNIQHARDYQKGIIDIPLFVRAIQDNNADVCGLNEVRGEGPMEGYTDQTNALGDGLGFHRYFGEAIKVGGTSPYGNAIVSRYPIKNVETVAIPDPEDRSNGNYFESRCVVKALIEVDSKDVLFLVCHMGLNLSERENAVETVCKLIDEATTPVILMGDFNTTPDAVELQPIRTRMMDTDACADQCGECTFPSDAPNCKIDYMFYKGLKCNHVQTIKAIYADHLPIICDFSL